MKGKIALSVLGFTAAAAVGGFGVVSLLTDPAIIEPDTMTVESASLHVVVSANADWAGSDNTFQTETSSEGFMSDEWNMPELVLNETLQRAVLTINIQNLSNTDAKLEIRGIGYDSEVLVYYIDGSRSFKVSSVKEFPFLAIKITDCKLNGDMPETIKYTIKWNDGRTESYTANVNSYSGNINYLEGYNVSFETEGSRFMSMITLRVGDIEDTESYEIEQAGFFARLIAKLTVFLKKVYSAVFPSKD